MTCFGDLSPIMLLTITLIYTFTSQHILPGPADGTSFASGPPCNVTLKALPDQHMLHAVADWVDQVPGQRTDFSQLTTHHHSNLSKCNRSCEVWQQAEGAPRCFSQRSTVYPGTEGFPIIARGLASPPVTEAAW